MIWYDDIYVTATGLTPGGSITRHIYNKQYTQYIENTILEVRAVPSLRVIPWHLPYNWGKSTEKTSVRVAQGALNLSFIVFHALSPLYALNRAHMRDIFLCCAKESQSKPPVLCTNLAALFWTRSKAFIWHFLYGSQHAAPYSSIGRTSDLYAIVFVFLLPFLTTCITKCKALQAFWTVQFTWLAQLKSLRMMIPKYLQELSSGIFWSLRV